MSDGWDTLKESRVSSLSGEFLKLKDKDSAIVAFRGEPYFFYSVYKDPLEYRQWAEGRTFRFRVNAVLFDKQERKMMIFEGGARVRDMILDSKEEYGLDAVYKIKRTGSNQEDTRYSILFQRKLDKDEMAAFGLMVLHPLSRKTSTAPPVKEPEPLSGYDAGAEVSQAGGEEVPF